MSIETAMKALEVPTTEPVQPEVKVETKVETKEEVKTEATTEETKEAAPEKTEEDELKSKRFAELSKKEQRILRKKLEMEKELKEREERIAAKEKEIKDSVKNELREMIKKNPKLVMDELGIDYNSLTNYFLSDGKLTPESVAQSVEEKIQALEKRLEEQAKAFEAKELARKEEENRKVLENFSATIIETIKTNAEKYPAVAAFDGAPVVYEMIQQRWHETEGQHLMTIDEACEILEKEFDSRISKVMQTPKYSAKAPQPKNGETKLKSPDKPKTITNELTSSGPSMLPPKTENDRIKRALEKLAGA